MSRVRGRRRPRKLKSRNYAWLGNEDIHDAEAYARALQDTHVQTFQERNAPTVIRQVRETSPWVPLAIGLGIVALVGLAGVVVYLLIHRNKDGSTTTLGAIDPRFLPVPQQPAPSAPQIYVINAGGGTVTTPASTSVAPNEEAAVSRAAFQPSLSPTLYRLPNTQAIALATAGAQPIEVTIGVIEPVNTVALLAFSPDMTAEMTTLSTGHERRIRVPPRRTLYGRGRDSFVTVTVASTS